MSDRLRVPCTWTRDEFKLFVRYRFANGPLTYRQMTSLANKQFNGDRSAAIWSMLPELERTRAERVAAIRGEDGA